MIDYFQESLTMPNSYVKKIKIINRKIYQQDKKILHNRVIHKVLPILEVKLGFKPINFVKKQVS